MSKDITLLKNSTADKIVDRLNLSRPNFAKQGVLPPRYTDSFVEAMTVKITSEADGNGTDAQIGEDPAGYYRASQVILDDTATDATTHAYIVPDNAAIDILIRETSGKTGIADDTVVKISDNGKKSDYSTIWEFTQGGGGTSDFYVEITSSVDDNNYLATIYNNPTDRTEIETDVPVVANQHTAGVLPNSNPGQGPWAVTVDGVNYLKYSVFY